MRILNKYPNRDPGTTEAVGGDELLVTGGHTFTTLTDKVSGIVETTTPPKWYLLFAMAVSGMMVLVGAIGWLAWEGTGVWGLNNPVGWGWAIVNFVFWVGIGHAG
ncbi:MAG: hypothetical protein KAS36_13955, partial [Anaerolineales bacterium]|nr:hypothetical protein [Anaerolineales bacterium]